MTAEMCGEPAAGEEVENSKVRRRTRRRRVTMAARGIAFAGAGGSGLRQGEEHTRGGGELASSRRL